MLLALMATGLISRALGPSAFGAYAYIVSWINVLIVLATLGSDRAAVRLVGLVGAGPFLRWGRRIVTLSASLVAVAVLCLWVIHSASSKSVAIPMPALQSIGVPVFAAASFWLLAMSALERGVVLGRERAAAAFFVDPFLRQLALASCAGALLLSVSTTAAALAAHAAAAFTTYAGFRIVNRLGPGDAQPEVACLPEADTHEWLRTGISYMFVGLVAQLSSEALTLLAGAMSSDEDAGILRVCTRVAGLLAYVLTATSAAVSGSFARLLRDGQASEAEVRAVGAARAACLVGLPSALFLWAQSDLVLSLFGEGFARGSLALRILLAGQVLNLLCGSVGQILMLSGHQTEVVRWMCLSLVLQISISAVLVKPLGVEGLALAGALSALVWNVGLTRAAWTRLGICPAAFWVPRSRAGRSG
jgi:O-antigen/teichoic acid export membrane protein